MNKQEFQLRAQARYNRVRTHFQDYGHIYLAAAGGVVVGALGMAAMKESQTTILSQSQIKSPLCWKPRNTINNTAVVEFAERSTPSKPIFDTLNNVGYGSIGEASRQTGRSRTAIRNDPNFDFLEKAASQ
jgi:hypothetical protein